MKRSYKLVNIVAVLSFEAFDGSFNFRTLSFRSAAGRRVCLRAFVGRFAILAIFFQAITVPSISKADVKRIVSINKDLSQVKKIYLHAGLVSAIEFNGLIAGVKIGNPNSIKAEISPSNPKEVTLRLRYQSAEPTNMLVRIEKKIYVFDLIPSRTSHQDYVKVSGSYGSPSYESSPSKPKSQSGHLVESIKIGGD